MMLHSIQNMGWTRDIDIKKLYFPAELLAVELKNKLCDAQSIMTELEEEPFGLPCFAESDKKRLML